VECFEKEKPAFAPPLNFTIFIPKGKQAAERGFELESTGNQMSWEIAQQIAGHSECRLPVILEAGEEMFMTGISGINYTFAINFLM
jgi:hypothetical protein